MEQGIQEEEKEGFERKVHINLYGEKPGGWEGSIGLSNVLENEDGEYERFDGLQVLSLYYIMGGEYRYNDLSTYKVLKDIQYLKVDEQTQEQAEEQGISWTDIWPNLRKVEVISR